MNVVSMIMQFLAPALINKMAGSLGIGQGLAGKAIAAALPSILAALAGSASKSGGAAALASAIARQDPNLLGNFANMLGGSGQQALVNSGSSALSSLLGGGATSAIAGAVGKFAGIEGGQSSSLLGLLAPVVLGNLGQVQKSQGLDAGGLANLLAGQKDNIAAALPPGFSNLLQGSGVFDAMSGGMKAAADTASMAKPMMQAAPSGSGGGFGKWVLPVALGVLGLYLLNAYGCSRTPEQAAAPEKPAASEPAPAPATTAPKTEAPAPAPAATPKADAPAIPAAGGDLIGIATKALAGMTQSLGTITDVETAKAAIPGLSDTAKQIDGLRTAAALLSGDAKKPLSLLVGAALPRIIQAVDRVVGIPGAGDVLKPVVDPMIANLAGLAE